MGWLKVHVANVLDSISGIGRRLKTKDQVFELFSFASPSHVPTFLDIALSCQIYFFLSLSHSFTLLINSSIQLSDVQSHKIADYLDKDHLELGPKESRRAGDRQGHFSKHRRPTALLRDTSSLILMLLVHLAADNPVGEA